ncbi:MFS transporter [Streptomyces purpurascens]
MTQSLQPRTTAKDAGEGTRVRPDGPGSTVFHISGRGSTVAREVRGGVTTFMAMAYILLLNPLILSGKDVAGDTLAQKGLITATAFAAALTTLLMGFVGKVPLALAAGLSVSGVLASQVAPEMTWPQALRMPATTA